MENKYVELEKLLKLKEQGAITVSEYEEEKKKILEKLDINIYDIRKYGRVSLFFLN